MRLFWEYLKSTLIAVIAALIFRSFFFEAYKIPSSSMTPTLMIGDYLFVSKYSYGYSKHSFPIALDRIKGRFFAKQPERGDIIVFKSPHADDDRYYIKRLVGLPGDKIQVRNAVVFINDTAVERKKVGVYHPLYKDEPQGIFNCYEETLPNGVRYNTLDANFRFHNEFPDQTAVYHIPQGYYFMMGDHRNRSVDSRFLSDMGLIPEENLVGRAQILFWTRDFSFWKIVTQFKLDRLFNRLTNDNTLHLPQ
ncbi:MAG: signal peptidase I [Candidatus Midichloria mitochondrii]|uniref:Signal peptidase I n=1 Tax=Midichloria mitochondrii (strain IricVA) TaxID=696127 RepID=F7XTX6_MIDMI|nr:signal peptidase I [Candidatus Midichloria mitochondrii]AEI89335.1 signal peptidase I [Candidatus Midichloria mitochondrii IricVA]MDJ1256827.1 signal peptidase I [Candidatus Midichloria mitochondrii]MDJ1288561.1 signal peptidase I [Candidatus Midichloria mitochondrii]MDJ1299410.1 signal peptidase I [Candidatus Midichloria mitochondrii]MDJ1313508.1 signal peptidase I [Candidatus Midichloria mitochondrii]